MANCLSHKYLHMVDSVIKTISHDHVTQATALVGTEIVEQVWIDNKHLVFQMTSLLFVTNPQPKAQPSMALPQTRPPLALT